ncbi:sensor histidine kinase [Deinococcus arenicola]|uniref:histidine kinase n=1 Tax=Deinococcus arenicola TaxID=2994950 RepID=A0ABU4DVY5_9DEIO|nr:ATP-binding protein [Deinococcus sp. ZS9-10]MDV6376623.1 ATP-binding protein [Deinococcus sp. ZS9-10]
MRLFPRFVLAFLLMAVFAILVSALLAEQAARGRIRGVNDRAPIVEAGTDARPRAAPPPQATPGSAPSGLPLPPPQDIRRLLGGLRVSQIGAGIVALSAALLVGTLLARRLVQPIQALTTLNRRYLAGERELRYGGRGSDELHELGQSFNQMADQIELEQHQHRQLVADVAHELRTPLTILKGELEYLQDGLSEPTPEVIGRLHEEVGLLERLVGDLRLLSLADSGGLSLHPVPLDLTTLTADVIRAFERRAQGHGTQISLSGSPTPLYADPERLRQVLYNLLDNALKHTTPGTRVECTVTREGQQARLDIRDHGPGLPAGSLERVFERLYRTDAARSRIDGGSGLGLSIVRTLTEAQGGRVQARNHPDVGAVFSVWMPIH